MGIASETMGKCEPGGHAVTSPHPSDIPETIKEPSPMGRPSTIAATSIMLLGMLIIAGAFVVDAKSSSTVTSAVADGKQGVALSSIRAIGDCHAHDLGALVEWSPGYYVAHDWSAPGKAITEMEQGDLVMLDGKELRIDGTATIDSRTRLNAVRDMCGHDAIIFQTCLSDDRYRIAYGYPTA